MRIKDRVIVITGAASGVGAAAARRFAADGARLVLTDINQALLREIAEELGATALAGDISLEATIRAVAALARERHDRIDIWFSNAGFTANTNGPSLEDPALWQRAWDVHVMAHVHAARTVLPEMLERGEGYLLQTASVVALSMQRDRAQYTVSKHAALSLSEWLATNYRPRGIRVSCFCPAAMDTPMLRASGIPLDHPLLGVVLTPEQVADLLVRGIEAEKFLIGHEGPTEIVPEFLSKGENYDAWLDLMGQQRLR
jgi:NAD(P)-dependent dehydrogenase (short-subunit alcohol dehydrogenase family)